MRFQRSLRQWLAVSIILKLAVTVSGVHAMCSDIVVNEPQLRGQALFTHYDMRLKSLGTNKEAARELVSKARVEEFWLRTWPELQAKALAENMSVAEMLEEPLILAKLYTNEMLGAKENRQIAVLQNGLIKDLEALEKMKPGGKLKANHWERIPRVMAGLYGVMQLAYEIEKVNLPEPTFNPFGKISVDLLLRVLESMDDSALDAMALAVEDARRFEQADSVSNTSTEIAPPEPTPEISTPNAAEVRMDGPTNQLLIVLKEKFPLSTSIVYSAKNPRGEEFTIEISSDIVAEDSGPEKHAVRRLLKSILHGTGGKSGIKPLFDVGPHIVELKAYVSGHKRILGCLEGRNLRLLKYGRMPTTRAGYARDIPANLCQ